MQKGPTEIAVVQISRTEYIMKCYRNIVDQIPQKRIYGPETNGTPIVYIGDLAFEIRARAVRHGDNVGLFIQVRWQFFLCG